MSEPKFTKGPQEVHPANENHGVYISDVAGRTICDFYFVKSGNPDDYHQFDNAKENATLYAAAPDMYEALEQLLGNAEVARFHLSATEEGMLVGSSLFDTINQARAALSRARGEGTEQ